MDIQRRINQLEDAQYLMKEALDLINEAVKGTSNESLSKAYIESHLRILIDSEHCYLDSSKNVEDLKNNLEII